jgi:2-succinyl-5-enolpyruvyl-6-hydroxy-3-cyclohexene-1-carboxylate synthase
MARAVVDEMRRHGVPFIVLSPGSRSGALAIAAAESEISTRVVIDERSAAFWALGRSKVTGQPSAVISTSGTAAANFLPGVVEADMSLTPLVVVSADRPAEMRGVGANQTIDQIDLFGNKVRFSAVIEAPGADFDGNDAWRSTVSKALNAARGEGGRPGPVHLNIAFREPTVPISNDGRSRSNPYPYSIEGSSGGHPWIEPGLAEPPAPTTEIPFHQKGVVVAGDGIYDRDALMETAASVGWPVVASALSGLRGRDVISHYHLTFAQGVLDQLRPEVVVAVGSVGPSQRLEALIGAADVRVRVDASGRTIDPGRNATQVVHADPVRLLGSVGHKGVDGEWRDIWSSVDVAVSEAVEAYLADVSYPSGPGVASAINRCRWETLVVASSLPVRDVDAHLRKAGPVIGNRGASGIDGFISTSLGVASSGSGALALSGDLSLLHDTNGFLAESLEDLIVIVIDNNGGGLFDLLPQASHAPQFERLFITPHRRSIEHLARLHDLGILEVTGLDDLPALVAGARGSGVTLLRVPVDRADDLAVRAALDEIGVATARSVLSKTGG